MSFLWGITAACAIGASGLFLLTILGAKGAPQEAAGAAMAVALVVIPYIFTRALEKLGSGGLNEIAEQLKALRIDYKIGVDALWQQLDRVRAATEAAGATPPNSATGASSPSVPDVLAAAVARVPAPASTAIAEPPPAATGAGMGYCPGCGKLRGLSVPKCVYCGDVAQARL